MHQGWGGSSDFSGLLWRFRSSFLEVLERDGSLGHASLGGGHGWLVSVVAWRGLKVGGRPGLNPSLTGGRAQLVDQVENTTCGNHQESHSQASHPNHQALGRAPILDICKERIRLKQNLQILYSRGNRDSWLTGVGWQAIAGLLRNHGVPLLVNNTP